MKPKLLFWIDPVFISYALAKSIQDEKNCDLFAIIDITDKPKRFFQNQKIVSFKKQWFFHDFIFKKKHVLDLDYLRSIEKKYDLPLTLFLSNDRFFNNFNKYYKFTSNEILTILEDEVRLFEKILDEVKPDFIVMSETNQQQNHIFYKICKAQKIKILMLAPARLPVFDRKDTEITHAHNYWYLADEADKFLPLPNTPIPDSEKIHDKKDTQLLDTVKSKVDINVGFQVSKEKYIKAILKYLFTDDTNVQSHYTYFGRSKLKVIFHMTLYEIRKKQRENFMKKNLPNHVKKDHPFIYFPLHQEQERVLLIGAPFYVNQIEIIKNIAKSLPIGYNLCVKDHPAMNLRGWRDISEMKEIMKIHNVILLHPETKSEKLIEESELVISIKGSDSIQAAFKKKPSIIFEKVGLYDLPSIHKIESISELPNAIKISLKKNVNVNDLQRYTYHVSSKSFEFRYHTIQHALEDVFKVGGYYANNEIDSEKMVKTLEKFKSELSFVASKFIERIFNEKD